jgi:hypothetical protein
MWGPLWELMKFFGGWMVGRAMDHAANDAQHGGGGGASGGGGGGGLEPPGTGGGGGWNIFGD